MIKSKQAIDAAFKIGPELTEAYIALGAYYYWGFLEYSQALKQFEIALNQSPKNSECMFLIACVHRRAGNWEKTIESFKRAFELDPRSARIAQVTGSSYASIREYSEALHYYNFAIMLSPEWPDPYLEKSLIYVNLTGNTQKARIILREANQMINSNNKQIVLGQMMVLELYDGNYEEALKYLPLITSDAFAFQGQNYFRPLYQYYAMLYGLMDNPKLEYIYYDSSRVILEDTLKLGPDDSRFYSSLGIAYAGLGRKEEAIAAGEKAVELLPVSKDADRGVSRLEDLARIYVMVGEYEKALEKIEFLLSIPGRLSTNLLQLDPVWIPLENNPKFIELFETYSENHQSR